MNRKIRKCLPDKLEFVEHLFAGWDETMVSSCLQGVMGSVYIEDGAHPASAAAQLNDFCFFAGEPNAGLIGFDYGRDFLIMVPQNEAWAEMIASVWGNKAVRRMRYAIKKEPNCFDMQKLTSMVRSLPEQFAVEQIDRELYARCLENPWSQDLVSGYPSYEDYARLGLGFVVTENGEILSGASSYSSYRGGIEIEIDTKEKCRRKGLATAAGAALILECLKRGLYPSWDAQNRASVALAEKLGYSFSHDYPVYEVKR